MSRMYNNEEKVSVVNEDNGAMRFYASQEGQELARLRESMGRSDTEKFYRLMGLMKVQNKMRKAIIHHKS